MIFNLAFSLPLPPTSASHHLHRHCSAVISAIEISPADNTVLFPAHSVSHLASPPIPSSHCLYLLSIAVILSSLSLSLILFLYVPPYHSLFHCLSLTQTILSLLVFSSTPPLLLVWVPEGIISNPIVKYNLRQVIYWEQTRIFMKMIFSCDLHL